MSASYASFTVLWQLSNQNLKEPIYFPNENIRSQTYQRATHSCHNLSIKAFTETLENANQMHLTQINYNFLPENVRQVQCQRRGREG